MAATVLYFFMFRRELVALDAARRTTEDAAKNNTGTSVPIWITAVQLSFMGFTVLVAHYPPLFIGGFLFFLPFSQATAHHQGKFDLKAPLLVGFFLAGLVVHGGLQAWWIEPVLKRLGEVPLFLGATILTAFNDNAAITYLATLVPGFTDPLKYAVVAGAVTGGGLTVIANAPNPAGQNILQRFFPDGSARPAWPSARCRRRSSWRFVFCCCRRARNVKNNDPKIWFPAKTYGWGWGWPCAWQGWVVMGVYLVLVAGGILLLPMQRPPSPKYVGYFVAYMFGLSGLLILVCWWKGEKPEWRWCGK